MAGSSNKGSGQRTSITSASGQKQRSPTSAPHTGSRVEPSRVGTKAQSEVQKARLKVSVKKKAKQG